MSSGYGHKSANNSLFTSQPETEWTFVMWQLLYTGKALNDAQPLGVVWKKVKKGPVTDTHGGVLHWILHGVKQKMQNTGCVSHLTGVKIAAKESWSDSRSVLKRQKQASIRNRCLKCFWASSCRAGSATRTTTEVLRIYRNFRKDLWKVCLCRIPGRTFEFVNKYKKSW